MKDLELWPWIAEGCSFLFFPYSQSKMEEVVSVFDIRLVERATHSHIQV